MAEGKKPTLVKLELIVFGVILLVFMIWVSRKCSRAQMDYEASARLAEETADDTVYAPSPAPEQPAAPAAGTAATARRPTSASTSVLYVCIEGLKMRSGPGLRHELIDQFPLYTELSFLGEVSSRVDTISLGKIMAAEPWVKVRSPKGREGWVYGAGVSYYKRKLDVE